MGPFKKAAIGIWIVSIIAVLSACGSKNHDVEKGALSKNNETISISGSTSVGPLAEKLASKYEKKQHVKIEINQIGSSAGITNAINGVSEIGMSSRDVKPEEKKGGLEETIIAYDGIVVVVHPSNPVKDLTLDQIKQVFTGQIKNWKELGGEDKEIVVVSREDGSGSRDAFQEIVGYQSGELERNSIIASGNGNIKTTVAMNTHALGFISFEYLDDSVAPLSVNGVEPTAENVLKHTYKLSRPFLFIHKQDKLTNAGQQFINYILSKEGQAVVSESGAIPVK